MDPLIDVTMGADDERPGGACAGGGSEAEHGRHRQTQELLPTLGLVAGAAALGVVIAGLVAGYV